MRFSKNSIFEGFSERSLQRDRFCSRLAFFPDAHSSSIFSDRFEPKNESEQTDGANPRPFGTSVMLPADPAARAGSTPEASGDSSSGTLGVATCTLQ